MRLQPRPTIGWLGRHWQRPNAGTKRLAEISSEGGLVESGAAGGAAVLGARCSGALEWVAAMVIVVSGTYASTTLFCPTPTLTLRLLRLDHAQRDRACRRTESKERLPRLYKFRVAITNTGPASVTETGKGGLLAVIAATRLIFMMHLGDLLKRARCQVPLVFPLPRCG